MPSLALVFTLVAAICAVLVLYPYAIYPLILRRLPTRPVHRQPGHRLTASLLFCAYNEARALPAKLANLERLKTRHPDLEVLVYDDGSSDGSVELLAARPDLLTLLRGEGRRGKAYGMKRLAACAAGEVLIFTDANVTLREDAIDNLMAWYADPEVGGLCGALHYRGADASATAAVGGRYWRQEERLKADESRTGNVMGADGAIFSLRSNLYPDFPDTVLDDLTVSMAAVFAGKRLIKVDDVVAEEGLVVRRGDEFIRKIRIAARAYHTHRHLAAQRRRMSALDRFKYASHKVLRWFGGGFLLLGLASATLAGLLVAPLPTLGAGLLLALVGGLGLRRAHGPAAAGMEVVLALIATLIGVFRALRGQTVVVWAPAKSR